MIRTARAAIVLRAFFPGALAGAQIAGLLFFLNPHLPFGVAPVARGMLYFGLVLGMLALVVTLPWTWDRPERSRKVLPWGLTTVLTAAALGTWTHASYYALFLPPGINIRMIKAAALLSLAAVICFYTALLHHLRRRPYGRRSHLLFGLMAVASIYFLMERREAFKPRIGPVPRATTFQGGSRPQLCVVGLDAATLDVILPLAEQGRLPFFDKILEEGAHARLSSIIPTRHDPLWSTLATGKYPYQHGVVGDREFEAVFLPDSQFLRLLPVGVRFERWGVWGEVRRVDAGRRQVLAIWEILARLEIPTAVVGWPLTSPPPSRVQLALSDRYFDSADPAEIRPPELAERSRLFRVRIRELDAGLVSRFGPSPPKVVLEALAADEWRQDLSFFLLDQDPSLDAFFLVLPGLREVSRRYFGAFSAVQFEGDLDPESVRGAQLLSAYYSYLDDFLAQLWARTPAPRLLVVASAHGAEGGHGGREAWRILSRRPAMEGTFDRGPDGVLMLLGEGLRPGQRVRSAELADLVPTLLYGMGFPIARDFDGAVLTTAFDTGFLARRPLSFVPSYETLVAERPPSR